MSTKSKAQHIEIMSVTRKRRVIVTTYQKGGDEFANKEHENPLPSFIQAFDALAPLVAIICHWPGDWVENSFRVVGLAFGTLGGAPTVSISCRKSFDDASKEFAFTTPERLLTHPCEEGTYSPPLTVKQAELIEEAREEAKRYLLGERAQGLLDFAGPKDDEEDDEDEAEKDAAAGQARLVDVPAAEPKTTPPAKKRAVRKSKAR